MYLSEGKTLTNPLGLKPETNHKVGVIALNFIPVVGPILSMLGANFSKVKKPIEQKRAEYAYYATQKFDPTKDWEGYLTRYPDVYDYFMNNTDNVYNDFGGNVLAWASSHYETAGKKENRVVYPAGQDPLRSAGNAPQTETIMQDAPAPANPAQVVNQPASSPSNPVVSSRTYVEDEHHYIDEFGRWINRHTGYDDRLKADGGLAGLKMMKLGAVPYAGKNPRAANPLGAGSQKQAQRVFNSLAAQYGTKLAFEKISPQFRGAIDVAKVVSTYRTNGGRV